MQSFPTRFTWREGEPIVCIVGADFVEAVNRAYEEDGEVELVDPDQRPAIEMPDYHKPDYVILIGPGGKPLCSGAGTGNPWEAFSWYARPEIVRVLMARSGPETGCYAVCNVQLRVADGADEKPRTWWGYANGHRGA